MSGNSISEWETSSWCQGFINDSSVVIVELKYYIMVLSKVGPLLKKAIEGWQGREVAKLSPGYSFPFPSRHQTVLLQVRP
jgi:hypothetical protein